MTWSRWRCEVRRVISAGLRTRVSPSFRIPLPASRTKDLIFGLDTQARGVSTDPSGFSTRCWERAAHSPESNLHRPLGVGMESNNEPKRGEPAPHERRPKVLGGSAARNQRRSGNRGERANRPFSAKAVGVDYALGTPTLSLCHS